MKAAFVFLLALTCAAGYCQSPAPEFVAADVHASPHTSNPFPERRGPFYRGGHYEVRSATMLDLIVIAYGVQEEKVLGGPSWLEMDRYDLIAKVPDGSTKETRHEMLKTLLADRFKLVLHNDTRPLETYVLTAGKHPKLRKAAEGSTDAGCKRAQQPAQTGGGPRSPILEFACRNMTMEAFARRIEDFPGSYQFLNGTHVVNQTALEGAWDFDFKYTLRGFGGASGDTPAFLEALERDLGLKLEVAKVPAPVLVVDSVLRKPTENPPDIAAKVQETAAPAEFEVAEIKPTAPDFRGIRFNVQPGGRINIQGTTLKFLIEQAWNVTDDMLVGAPKWMDTDRWDIIAKATTAVPEADNQQGPPIDIDTVIQMVQGLVTERFKLAMHEEVRPVDAYTLMAVRPKMKKADPASRTLFKEGPLTLDGKDPRVANPSLSRLVTVQNMTMAQFAEKLQAIAPGYIHSPVLDATNLEGSWDFTLSFSPVGQFRGPGPGDGGRGGEPGRGVEAARGPGAAIPEATDPGVSLTLFEALEKEVGLKLIQQKRPVPVLVIDHVEPKPVDN